MSDSLMLRGPSFGGQGTGAPFRADGTGAQAVADAHGRYAEATRRAQAFFACNQAATAVSVALATTYTGIVLSNPASSKVNLELLLASFALSVAPAAIAPLLLFGGWASTGLVTHTTPLTALSTMLNQDQATGSGKADAAATLVGTPRWVLPIMGGFTAAALPGTSPAILDVAGAIVVPPGGYVGIGALTAVTGFGGLLWEETPVIAAG
jgi:hypothetical protein